MNFDSLPVFIAVMTTIAVVTVAAVFAFIRWLENREEW